MFGIRDFYVFFFSFKDLSAFCTVIKMLINLYMICGSFDMNNVICRSFVFSFRYLAQRFTLRFII